MRIHLRLIVPIIFMLGVYVPSVWHFKSFNARPGSLVVASSRQYPADSVDVVLATVTVGVPVLPKKSPAIVALADGLLGGRVDHHGLATKTIAMPFDETLVMAGTSSWQLDYSGFFVPRVLLEAYRLTARESYLHGAIAFALAWLDYEKNTWVPNGFVWNDHAVASRATIICDIWRYSRGRSDVNDAAASGLLELAKLAANTLSQPILYNFRTNHGTMQSVALAKLSLCFPVLLDKSIFGDVAIERLLEQLQYFFGAEGVVREHSLGYHAFGVKLAQEGRDLARLLRPEHTDRFESVLELAKRFLDTVARPDRMLARIGDTNRDEISTHLDNPMYIGRSIRSSEEVLLPSSGYYIKNTAGVERAPSSSQFIMFWQNINHKIHKHADDLSIHLWHSDVDWLTASGYWPYWLGSRRQGISWQGSNAPHFLDEAGVRHAPAALLGHASHEGAFALDGRRQAGDGHVRRQVISPRESVWILLDSFESPGSRTFRTVWLTDPSVKLSSAEAQDTYYLEMATSGVRLSAQFSNSRREGTTLARGDQADAIGWVARNDRHPMPASAVVVQLPGSGWSLAAFGVLPSARNPGRPVAAEMRRWQSPEHWTIDVADERGGQMRLLRAGRGLTIERQDGALNLEIGGASPISPIDPAADSAFAAAQARYDGPFEPLWKYRLRILQAALALFALDVGLVAAVGRRYRFVIVLSPIFWTGAALWVQFVYLVK